MTCTFLTLNFHTKYPPAGQALEGRRPQAAVRCCGGAFRRRGRHEPPPRQLRHTWQVAVRGVQLEIQQERTRNEPRPINCMHMLSSTHPCWKMQRWECICKVSVTQKLPRHSTGSTPLQHGCPVTAAAAAPRQSAPGQRRAGACCWACHPQSVRPGPLRWRARSGSPNNCTWAVKGNRRLKGSHSKLGKRLHWAKHG